MFTLIKKCGKVLCGCLFGLVGGGALSGQEAQVETRDLGSWWDRSYLEGRGLVLFGTDPGREFKTSAERAILPLVVPLSQKNEIEESPTQSRAYQRHLYSPFGLVFPSLGGTGRVQGRAPIETRERFVMVLRLQSDLDSEPANAKPATLQWQNDAGSEAWMTTSAVITEFYFPGLNGPFLRSNTNDGIGFHLVAGAAWDRFDGDEDQIDSRKFKLLGEFVAFPGTLGKVMNSSQLMKVGVSYEEDAVKDVDRFTLDIQWNPAIGVPVTFGGGDDEKIRTLWIGGRTYIKDGKFISNQEVMRANDAIETIHRQFATGQISAPAYQRAIEEQLPKLYLSIKPDLGLELGESEEFSDVLNNFSDGAVRYGIEAALSLNGPLKLPGKLELVYKLIGRSFFDGGESHLFHEASVVYKGKYLPMSVSASYEYGENAPDYEKRDLVKVGVGLKF